MSRRVLDKRSRPRQKALSGGAFRQGSGRGFERVESGAELDEPEAVNSGNQVKRNAKFANWDGSRCPKICLRVDLTRELKWQPRTAKSWPRSAKFQAVTARARTALNPPKSLPGSARKAALLPEFQTAKRSESPKRLLGNTFAGSEIRNAFLERKFFLSEASKWWFQIGRDLGEREA